MRSRRRSSLISSVEVSTPYHRHFFLHNVDFDCCALIMRCLRQPINVKVGKADKSYVGYRKMTKSEWCDPAIGIRLVATHELFNGWFLLEEPLECSGGLYVDEGYVQADGSGIVEEGYNGKQHLRGTYIATNFGSKTSWRVSRPSLPGWTVEKSNSHGQLCLFVRQVRQCCSKLVFTRLLYTLVGAATR